MLSFSHRDQQPPWESPASHNACMSAAPDPTCRGHSGSDHSPFRFMVSQACATRGCRSFLALSRDTWGDYPQHLPPKHEAYWQHKLPANFPRLEQAAAWLMQAAPYLPASLATRPPQTRASPRGPKRGRGRSPESGPFHSQVHTLFRPSGPS